MLHIKRLSLKSRVFRYLGILLGCLISSSSINLFVVPSHLLSGGVAGIAMIFYYLFALPIGVQMFLYNLPLLAAAYKTLGRDYTLDIAFGTILFSFCVDATRFLNAYAPVPDTMLAAIFGGVLNVAACALVLVVITLSMRTVPIPSVNTALGESKTLTWMVEATPSAVKDRIDSVRNDVLTAGSIPEVKQLLYPETNAPTQQVQSDALENASSSVVQILGAAEQCGYTSTGSGFVAGQDLVVTNSHVLSGVTSPTVQDSRGRTYPGTVVYNNPAQDLAFIRVPRLPIQPLQVANTNSESGETVTFMGYPKGGPFAAKPATVQGVGNIQTIDSETGKANPTRQVYQIAADVQHGNSGGPMLTQDGTVVGVVFAKATEGQTGYAITASTLKQALAANGNNTTPVSTGQCKAR